MAVFSLRFEEKLMLGFIGKSCNFCFDAGAIPGTDTFDLSVEEGRIGQSLSQNVMDGFVGIGNPAVPLLQCAMHAVEIGKFVEVVFSFLYGHKVVMYAPSVDTHRGSGFHSSGGEPLFYQLFGYAV